MGEGLFYPWMVARPSDFLIRTLICLSLVGCSCDGDDDTADTPTDASAPTTDGAATDGSVRDLGGADADSRRDLGPRPDGSGPEVCDGVDNDLNGVIDDVDVGGDGVCDCLIIATLGRPGEWGDGDVFAAWLDERSDIGATELGDQVLTPALLEPFQVIVAQDLRGREYAASEVDALRGWIESGGGLMTLIGYGDSDERTQINRLLEPTGIAYDGVGILAGSPTIPVTEWTTHPVTDRIEQVGVNNGYEVIGEGDVIAREAGLAVLRAKEMGAGKVLVWGDEWITYDSEWTEHPEYQLERFWLNAIKWLTPSTECQVPILI